MHSPRHRCVSVCLWLVFFVNGAVLSSWAPRIPEVKNLLGLSDSELGIALFGIAAGSVPALLLTARLLDHLRSGPVCVVTAAIFSAALPLIGAAGNLWQLTGVLIVLGAASGVLDIAMNTAGIAYKQHTGRRLLSRLHGGYSLGVLAGAGGGVIATHLRISVTEHFLAVAAVLVILALVCAPGLWAQPWGTAGRGAPEAPVAQRTRLFSLPLAIAVLAVSGLLIEGLITDWSALLITRDLQAPACLGASALALFSLAMFISRSAGDAVLNRIPEKTVLVAVAIVVASLVITGTLLAQPVVMVAAIGLIGLMLGPVFPLAVSRASRSNPGRAAAMTAQVSAVGYFAYLAGPPGIGLIAEGIGLPIAFAAVVILSCLGIGAARRGPNEASVQGAALRD
ncbi:MFS transporter [Kocuria palustris]|uniref:MFS transporter n=1 Tax=Kocuria palustris TaxID=71999 RepID=UPI00077B7982|nr:MFS transporter [Kocuria palustris]